MPYLHFDKTGYSHSHITTIQFRRRKNQDPLKNRDIAHASGAQVEFRFQSSWSFAHLISGIYLYKSSATQIQFIIIGELPPSATIWTTPQDDILTALCFAVCIHGQDTNSDFLECQLFSSHLLYKSLLWHLDYHRSGDLDPS